MVSKHWVTYSTIYLYICSSLRHPLIYVYLFLHITSITFPYGIKSPFSFKLCNIAFCHLSTSTFLAYSSNWSIVTLLVVLLMFYSFIISFVIALTFMNCSFNLFHSLYACILPLCFLVFLSTPQLPHRFVCLVNNIGVIYHFIVLWSKFIV